MSIVRQYCLGLFGCERSRVAGWCWMYIEPCAIVLHSFGAHLQSLDGMQVPMVCFKWSSFWMPYADITYEQRLPTSREYLFVQKMVLKMVFQRWRTVFRCFMWIVWSFFVCFVAHRFSVHLVNCWFRNLLGAHAGYKVTFKETLGVVKSCNCWMWVATSLVRIHLRNVRRYIPQKCLAIYHKQAMNKRRSMLMISVSYIFN